MPVFDEAFRELCIKVADETDPKKLELLKQRLRLLLLQEQTRKESEQTAAEH